MCEFAPGLGEYPLLKCDKECTSFLFMFANTCKWNMKCHRYNPPRIALYLYLNGCVVFDIPCVRFANYPSCVPVYGGFILARCVCSRVGEMFWVWDSPLPSTARECGVASPPHRLCTLQLMIVVNLESQSSILCQRTMELLLSSQVNQSFTLYYRLPQNFILRTIQATFSFATRRRNFCHLGIKLLRVVISKYLFKQLQY